MHHIYSPSYGNQMKFYKASPRSKTACNDAKYLPLFSASMNPLWSIDEKTFHQRLIVSPRKAFSPSFLFLYIRIISWSTSYHIVCLFHLLFHLGLRPYGYGQFFYHSHTKNSASFSISSLLHPCHIIP